MPLHKRQRSGGSGAVMVARSDRPWSRKLIRISFRALGRARAHHQDIWPNMLVDNTTQRVLWRGRKLVSLHDASTVIPVGLQSIAVVGSGPSLRNQKVENIGKRTGILCNGAIVLAERLSPLAIAVEDERFVFRHHSMLSRLSKDIPAILSPAVMRAWAECDADSLRDRPVVMVNNIEKPVNGLRRPLSDPELDDILIRSGPSALSKRPTQGVVITGTIAFSALQFALAAAPSRILLAGVDLGNSILPRFYEENDCAKSGLAAGLPRILPGFSLAKEYATREGISLRCASPTSELITLGYQIDNSLNP